MDVSRTALYPVFRCADADRHSETSIALSITGRFPFPVAWKFHMAPPLILHMAEAFRGSVKLSEGSGGLSKPNAMDVPDSITVASDDIFGTDKDTLVISYISDLRLLFDGSVRLDRSKKL